MDIASQLSKSVRAGPVTRDWVILIYLTVRTGALAATASSVSPAPHPFNLEAAAGRARVGCAAQHLRAVRRYSQADLRAMRCGASRLRQGQAGHLTTLLTVEPRNRSWTRPSGPSWGGLARLSVAAPSVPAHAWTARRRQASGLRAACKADDAARFCPQGGATPPARHRARSIGRVAWSPIR